MKKEKEQIINIIFGSLVGAVLSGLSSAYVWYHFSYRFYEGSFPSPEASIHTLYYAVLGLVFGIVGGALAGGAISGYQLKKHIAVLVGIGLNVFFPLFVFVLEGIYKSSTSTVKIFLLSIFGQVLIGGVIGLTIVAIDNYFSRRHKENLSSEIS